MNRDSRRTVRAGRTVHSAAALVLVLLAAAPFAWAQQGTGKKKGTKAAPSASASADPAPDTAAAAPDTASASASADATPPPPPKEQAPPDTGGSSTDVTEKPGQSYIFIGLRYRGDFIPKFMVNLFVDEGASFYSNTFGVEADFRKDGFSLIPALTYVSYGTGGNILFLQKNADPTNPGNWSYVNSSLKAIYATADLMWSTKLHKNVDFEYGAGFGLGVIFGGLVDDWVYGNNNGPLKTTNPKSPYSAYSPCPTGADGTLPMGCNKADHQNASVAKVGGYTEPSWVNGGSKPNVFPWIGIPQFGLRFKPVKQMEARLTIGFSLTGFWFGLSANYGLEKTEKK